MAKPKVLAGVALLLAVLTGQPALATVLTFEGIPDSTPITTEFPGFTFTNATVITAGITLNEFEFPPHSGDNVVFDDGSLIITVFDSPQASVAGFFTYLVPITLIAFDALNNLVAMDTSDFLSNVALSGDPGSSPNEVLQVAFAGGIKTVVIQGDLVGSSFVLDDLTFNPLAVPEPPVFLLFASGLKPHL